MSERGLQDNVRDTLVREFSMLNHMELDAAVEIAIYRALTTMSKGMADIYDATRRHVATLFHVTSNGILREARIETRVLIPYTKEQAVKRVSELAKDGSWASKVSTMVKDKQLKARDILAQGLADGKSKKEIETDIESKVLVKNWEGWVRTEVQRVNNAAEQDLYKQNEDLLAGQQFIATLDSRTCPVCQSLDGKIFLYPDLAGQVQTPVHDRCRCTYAPVMKGPEELKAQGIQIDKKTERLLLNQPTDRMSYQDWISRQPEETQRRALGKNYDAFQKGYTVDSFVAKGRVIDPGDLPNLEAPPIVIAPKKLDIAHPVDIVTTAPVVDVTQKIVKAPMIVKGSGELQKDLKKYLQQKLDAEKAKTAAKKAELDLSKKPVKKTLEPTLQPGAVPVHSWKASQDSASQIREIMGSMGKSTQVVCSTKKRSLEVLQASGKELARFTKDYPDLMGRLKASGANLTTIEVTHGPWLMHKGKGCSGLFTRKVDGSQILQVASGAGKIEQNAPSVGKWITDPTPQGAFRHEFGHYVYYNQPGRAEWDDLHSKSQWTHKQISSYGTTNERESFAESFCAWTHANYKPGSLPANVEEFMARRVGPHGSALREDKGPPPLKIKTAELRMHHSNGAVSSGQVTAISGTEPQILEEVKRILAENPYADIRLARYISIDWPVVYLRSIEGENGYYETIEKKQVPGSVAVKVNPATIKFFNKGVVPLTPKEKEVIQRVCPQECDVHGDMTPVERSGWMIRFVCPGTQHSIWESLR